MRKARLRSPCFGFLSSVWCALLPHTVRYGIRANCIEALSVPTTECFPLIQVKDARIASVLQADHAGVAEP